MGERGGVNIAGWLKSQGIETNYTNKKAAEKAYKKFLDANPETKEEITKTKWIKEGKKLATEFNNKVQAAFDAKDMSKVPSWKKFLESKNLKHAGVTHYQSNREFLKAVDTYAKKRELVDILINDNTNDFKQKPWIEIQQKVSPGKTADFNIWRDYIDKHNKLNGNVVKARKAFDYLRDNDVALKISKDLSKTMTTEGSLLRKAISDLSGAGIRDIRKALDGLDDETKKLINFANQSKLWTEGEGRTLNEIFDDAVYRMEGNVSWSSDIKKLAHTTDKNIFDYALRHFNHHGKYNTGKSQITFYYKGDTEMKNPIKWDEVEWDNKGGKKLKPGEVFFVDSSDPNKKWDKASIRADHKNWTRNKNTHGLFNELYKARDVYDNLLNTEVINPRDPNGPKVKFGKIMKDVYGIGYDNFGNPYAIEHGDGVAKSPWKNLRIAESRVNQALFNITDKYKGLDEGVRKKIINELNKKIFNIYDPKIISKITKGQEPIIQSILGESKIPTQKKLLPQLIENFSNNFSKTFQDLSPQSVMQLAKKHGCIKRFEGGSAISCLQTKLNKDPQGFLQRSATLAADGRNANMLKWLKRGRALAKGTGVLALWEAAFAPVIAAPMFAKGESGSRILNEIAYGVPFIGETQKEELKKYLGDDAYKLNRFMEIGGEEVATWDPSGKKYEYKPGELDYLYGSLGPARTVSDAIKKSKAALARGPVYMPSQFNVERIEDKIKKTEQEQAKLWNELGLTEGPAGKYLNWQKVGDVFSQRDKGLLDLAMDKNRRRQKRIESGIVADPSWHKHINRYMGGGMVGIRKPHAIPPERQGLRSIMINVNDD